LKTTIKDKEYTDVDMEKGKDIKIIIYLKEFVYLSMHAIAYYSNSNMTVAMAAIVYYTDNHHLKNEIHVAWDIMKILRDRL
jgi:hypothetical protein